ncbi:MAG: hypothetical protein ACO3FI_08775, partial [Cyclobacteriaceae bacterium]
ESLTVLQVDELMQTTKKSRDVQNKRRSQIIRSINLKASGLFKIDGALILSRRLEMDGRMIDYLIAPGMNDKLARWLRK